MSFRITTKVVDRASKKLENAFLAAEKAIPRAINKVASKAFTRAGREIRSQVNLTADYLKKQDRSGNPRLALSKAASNKPFAEIKARVRPTRLATYSAKQLRRKAKTGKDAKGDPLRKIPAGSKSAGVSVKVKKGGARKQMRGAFMIPLKRGNDLPGTQGMGVFIRVGTGRSQIKHLYGPSVDQVFRDVAKDIKPEVEKELRETLRKQLKFESRRVNA